MITVVIPTYKNKEQIIANIRHNKPFFKDYSVILINDYPEDNISKEFAHDPQITVINNEKNLGFGLTVNKGIRKAQTPFVLLLNSDVVLKDSSYEMALKHFENDTQLFAVSFAQQEADDSIVGRNMFFWKDGMFHHNKDVIELGPNAWVEAGTCLLDTAKFNELGGFDELYKPFYWEDIDLSYRAWKQGYRILFDPAILVEHHHESTIGKYFNRQIIDQTAYRNQFIFIWKNITDSNLFINHLYYLPYNLLYYGVVKKQPQLIAGFFDALKKIKTIIKLRNAHSKLSDKQILALFSNVHS